MSEMLKDWEAWHCTCLGGRVVRLARVAEEADDGGDVDDAPLLALGHQLARLLAAVKHARQVGVNHFLPLLRLHSHQQIVARNA